MRQGLCTPFILLAVLVSLPVCAEEIESAPNQHRQPLYLSAHPSLFTVPDASEVFEKDLYPAPEFLPTDLYDSKLLQGEIANELLPEEDLGIRQTEYPYQDSAARDSDPEGHYSEPKWNQFSFLSEQFAKMPRDDRWLVRKEIAVTDTVLFPNNSDFGMNTLDVRSTLYLGQLPILNFTPRFGYHSLMNEQGTGLPSQLYDAGLDISLFLPLAEKWSFLGAVGPSVFTDGENTSSQAFRMTGRAIGMYQWSETIKLTGGFVYLGRADLKVLPFAGAFYRPSERVKVELVFPRPKFAYRLQKEGDYERWCYVTGEFGGGSWAVERNSGFEDVVSIRDYRLVTGVESINGKEFRWLVEAGFVFGRKIEYNTGIGNSKQSPTGMVRGGIVF